MVAPTFWSTIVPKARPWLAKQPVAKVEEVEKKPESPAPVKFFYRRSYDSGHAELAPYGAMSVRVGHRTYPTAAHLYWALAFCQQPVVIRAIDALTLLSDHDESLAKLLRIAIEYRHLLPQNDTFPRSREDVMTAIQLFKFTQHESLRKELVGTGDADLLYTQSPSPPEATQAEFLDWMAKQLFTGTATPSRYGPLGKPLPLTWGSLLHPDDIFWGVDPVLDPAGKVSNRLGAILMNVRKYLKEDDGAVAKLCTSAEALIASFAKLNLTSWRLNTTMRAWNPSPLSFRNNSPPVLPAHFRDWTRTLWPRSSRDFPPQGFGAFPDRRRWYVDDMLLNDRGFSPPLSNREIECLEYCGDGGHSANQRTLLDEAGFISHLVDSDSVQCSAAGRKGPRA